MKFVYYQIFFAKTEIIFTFSSNSRSIGLRNFIFIIFLFVAGGKFHQVSGPSALLDSKTCGLQVKKSDKSPVFFKARLSKFSKPKKRKPKGIEIKTVGVKNVESVFSGSRIDASQIYYSSPELLIISNWVPGRAPPMV